MLKSIMNNPIMLTDCYNLSHQNLKESTKFEVSHFYNRANPMILFGFKEIVTELLSIKITREMVDEAEEHAKRMGLAFPKGLWLGIVNECEGNIPIKVEMLPEGTYCPTGTPFAQIRNTVEGYGELVTWFEGLMMMAYFPSSCATEAFNMRNYLKSKQMQYGYDDSFMWRFHSFGYRGHKSLQDAYFAGTAWNLFLQGTDDFHIAQHMPVGVMGSISALAHKVTQQFDSEYQCFIRAINQTALVGEKIVALVIDTYNAWDVIKNWVLPLAEYAKLKGVNVVFRPDSGDIFEQACAIYDIVEQEKLTNVSVIIGEGMSFQKAREYDKLFELANVPLNFVNYGIGAGFYKNIERDTLGWALKTAYSNGKPRMKVVKSDPFKQSIPNMIHLKYNEQGNMTVCDGDGDGLFEVIYDFQLFRNEDGSTEWTKFVDVVTDAHFDKVRTRALLECTAQEKIVLSEETQTRIDEFHAMHDK